MMCPTCFHPFYPQPSEQELPLSFTFPFQYEPHALVQRAACELQQYLKEHDEWQEELQDGKMMGVLLVRNKQGVVGFLAAFSGLLQGTNRLAYFVPPVFDFLDPEGFFKKGEAILDALNLQVKALEEHKDYQLIREQCAAIEHQASVALRDAKEAYKLARQERALLRETASPDMVKKLNQESQFQKAELKRMEKQWNIRLEEVRKMRDAYEEKIKQVKQERKSRSEVLQQEIFHKFRFLNARGEEQSLKQIFLDAQRGAPPAGSGECAAPKLLQYAYQHQLHPLAMGEFWVGKSPRGVLREHGHFYPSCTNKCKPILGFMLQGLTVDTDPVLQEAGVSKQVRILYEDDAVVAVSKPAGMYSVPGKDLNIISVLQWAKMRYPDADSPLLVHRLDMHTSGILLIGKTKEAHAALQQQFERQEVRKTYIAILDGVVTDNEGIIRLPLCPDVEHRPMQMVDYTYGKPAVTRYRVLQRTATTTRVVFFPLTGRTHQLRVHAAHPNGLGCAIRGDLLYGQPSERLFLHAEQIQFLHPITGKRLHLKDDVPF